MTTLHWIILTTFLGGALSICIAAVFAFAARASWIGKLISYAIGALLGAVFLEILPHAFELTKSIQHVTGSILFGILLFFVLEKLVLWRHSHGDEFDGDGGHGHSHGHGADHGRSGLMIMIGTTFHNLVDGVIIAAAFIVDVKLGVVTALAIVAHEIPQEVSDFLILLHSGYTKRQALAVNLLSSAAMMLGGVLAYFALQSLQQVIPVLLGIAAASMIYVAVADLIPGLHKRTQLAATLEQILLIGLGVGSIWLTHFVMGRIA